VEASELVLRLACWDGWPRYTSAKAQIALSGASGKPLVRVARRAFCFERAPMKMDCVPSEPSLSIVDRTRLQGPIMRVVATCQVDDYDARDPTGGGNRKYPEDISGDIYHRLEKGPSMMLEIGRILALCAVGLIVRVSQAADLAPKTQPTGAAAPAAAADKIGNARALISAKQWPAAIDELRRVNDTSSADWNNLMGYTLRKGNTPDLAASEKYYDEALRIDPHHRNTLEYSGELYLMKGELDKAQARLAALSIECSARCEQYAELKAAIERYKAAGNKYGSTTW
jgi:hypothetical protein